MIKKLISGTKLDNTELCEIFGCSPQGGMRRAHKTNSLVLISNHVKSIYDDRWEDDVLLYTGMGTKGDQSLDFAQNKTLAESNHNGVSVHLLEVFKDKEYTYVGQVLLCSEPYQEKQTDEDGHHRQVYVFPLKLTSGERLVTEQDRASLTTLREKQAKRLSDEELKQRAVTSSRKPSRVKQRIAQFERNPWVSEYAKRIAGGTCQLCLKPAPFRNDKGQPYLETHHIKWLSAGGDDSIENTVALCPNCHRKMHIVNSEKDIVLLKDLVKNLVGGLD